MNSIELLFYAKTILHEYMCIEIILRELYPSDLQKWIHLKLAWTWIWTLVEKNLFHSSGDVDFTQIWFRSNRLLRRNSTSELVRRERGRVDLLQRNPGRISKAETFSVGETILLIFNSTCQIYLQICDP